MFWKGKKIFYLPVRGTIVSVFNHINRDANRDFKIHDSSRGGDEFKDLKDIKSSVKKIEIISEKLVAGSKTHRDVSKVNKCALARATISK